LLRQLYWLLGTICGEDFLASSCALTFWICDACSLRLAVSALISCCCSAVIAWKSFCCCTTVASNFSTLRCSLRNSLQHRVHRLIAHGKNLSPRVTSHQSGVHLFHFLGHEAKLRDALGIKLLLVAEGHPVLVQGSLRSLYPSV